MRIDAGLLDAMVMQRTEGDVCDAPFSGVTVAKVTGPVRAKATSKGKTVRGFAATVVGRVTKGKIAGRLKGLPVGGPYDIELSVEAAGESETLIVRDVLVGDVWVLGGQSNMQGIGRIDPPIRPNAMVRACYMTDRWDVAQDVIHDLYRSVDPVHSVWAKLADGWGRGPGVPFGHAMFEATGVPQGLIPCAHGGSAMHQWDPALKELGGGSMFGAAVRRVKKNGGRVAGVLWYQGCSDTAAEMVPLYEKRTKTLFEAFRREYSDAKLPIVMVQIARYFFGPGVEGAIWNRVQEIQRRLALSMKRVVCVPAIDLPLDDLIHISGHGQMRLGVRLADAMLALTMPKSSKSKRVKPIELDRVEAKDRGDGYVNVHVKFRNVVGKLTSLEEPRGFAIVDANGQDTQAVYATELVGATAIVRTMIAAKDIGSYSLSYGHDKTPVCNIVDEGDRSLPVFCGQRFGKK